MKRDEGRAVGDRTIRDERSARLLAGDSDAFRSEICDRRGLGRSSSGRARAFRVIDHRDRQEERIGRRESLAPNQSLQPTRFVARFADAALLPRG
jgi:hypothetical protein